MEQQQRCLVLYASQTGNAQDVAERIGREAGHQQLNAVVISMDAYDPNKLSEEDIVIFVASTTGQGDPPDSMKSFWRFLLRRSLQSSWLKNLHYAVFGLGDSGYLQYNVVAKKLDKRLSDLGGKPIIAKGLGDDQHPSGYEAALDPWLVSLWSSLRKIFPLQLGSSLLLYDNTKLSNPKYQVTFCGSSLRKQGNFVRQDYKEVRRMFEIADGLIDSAEQDDPSIFGPQNPFLARMICNKQLTENADDRDVRHIEFDLRSSGIVYQPGDALAVLPSQDEKSMDAFFDRCHLDPEALVLVEARSSTGPNTRPAKPVTLRAIVNSMMDIASASPRRYFFEVMSHFATAEHEKERLKYFGSPEGRDDLYQYNQRERRTVLEVLEDFPSVQLPLEWLLQLVPRLQPRLFSISSSMLAHPNQVHITVAVKKWKTPFKRTRHGLCSTWLSRLDPCRGEISVPVWIHEGSLKLPHPSVPLLLIGPGTGCAPFRAFVEERAALSTLQNVAPILFFFGCRSEKNDFLYKEFWLAQASGSGVLSGTVDGGFFVAFSRDQPTKVYVQHKILEHSAKVWRMLQSGCSVHVAGSANKMPADVESALADVLMKEGGVTRDFSKEWLKQLRRAGKYYVEAW